MDSAGLGLSWWEMAHPCAAAPGVMSGSALGAGLAQAARLAPLCAGLLFASAAATYAVSNWHLSLSILGAAGG